MDPNNKVVRISLETVLADYDLTWADELTWETFQNTVYFLLEVQLFLLLFGLGVLFFIIGMIFKR